MPQQPASSSSTSAPGMRSSSATRRRRAAPAPSGGSGRGRGSAGRRAASRPQRERAVVDRLDEQLLDQPRLRRDGLRARVAGQQRQVLLAQRQQARRLAADDRRRRARRRARAGRPSRSAIARASSSRPLEMLARPQQPRALQPHVASPAASSSSIAARPIAGLGERRERVGEEDDVAARAAVPRRSRRASQRSSVSRSKRGSGRRRSMPSDPLEQPRAGTGQVRQRRGRRAEPVQRAGSRRTAASAAACRGCAW